MKTNGSDLAFDPCNELNEGLSKREHFAAMAMQGLVDVSEPEYIYAADSVKSTAEMAVRYADALIAQLNKSEAEG